MAIKQVGAVVGAVALALGAVGAAAFGVAKKMADLTNELNDLSVRSGLATKTISALRFSLIASGQPAESLNEILGAISGQFAQLSQEGSAVEKKFNQFGISVRDVNGDLRSNNEIMLDGIKLLQGIGDTSERSRVAVSLFGEAGAKLNQALAAGDFEKFLAFTQKFGVKTGVQASKTAANFQVALSGLTLSFNGLLQKFTQSTGLIDKVTDRLIDIGTVFAFVGSLIESFSAQIGTFAEAFERDFKVIMDILGVFVDLISETAESLLPMGDAFDRAFKDAEEFRAGMDEFKKTLVTVNSASADTENALDNIGDAAKNAKKEVRDFTDIVNDLLNKFVKLDVGKLLGDILIVFKTFDKDIGNLLIKLSAQISKVGTEIGLFPKRIPFDPQTLAELDAIQTQMFSNSGGISISVGQSFTKVAKIFDNKIGEILRNLIFKIQEGMESLAGGLLLGFDDDTIFKT